MHVEISMQLDILTKDGPAGEKMTIRLIHIPEQKGLLSGYCTWVAVRLRSAVALLLERAALRFVSFVYFFVGLIYFLRRVANDICECYECSCLFYYFTNFVIHSHISS